MQCVVHPSDTGTERSTKDTQSAVSIKNYTQTASPYTAVLKAQKPGEVFSLATASVDLQKDLQKQERQGEICKGSTKE